MPLFLKTKKHLFTRLPTAFLVIVLIGIGPIIIGLIGSEWFRIQTGQPCHAGNCEWAIMHMLCMLTIPVAGVLLFILAIIAILDTIELFRNKTT